MTPLTDPAVEWRQANGVTDPEPTSSARIGLIK
jgi:hypothetical protein